MMILGLLIAIGSIVGLSVMTGMKGKKDSGGIGAGVAAGLIMGTLVGGTSTVGTAQLAYNYGMTAWWFTLGGGIGCLILGLIYARPLRAQGKATLVGMIHDGYGERVGLAATVLNSLGTFINILSQMIAASAVLLVVFPESGNAAVIAAAAVCMVCYVVFGGTKGAGIVGILKTVLLSATMLICGVLVLRFTGGIAGFCADVNGIRILNTAGEAVSRNLWSLFGRGFWTDFGSCLSLILGVLTTQAYAQAILTARSDREARLGALISGVLISIIGVFGILVGLYMRSIADPVEAANNSGALAKVALTSFILHYSGIPPFLGGLMLGALFIASVGTGAGLALGIATVVNRDLINGGKLPADRSKYERVNRLIISCVLAGAAIITCLLPADTIQDYAFLSMALRGCTVFAPLSFLLWSGERVTEKWALLSVVFGCGLALVYGVLKVVGAVSFPLAAVFPGIAVGLLFMIIGIVSKS